MIINVTISRFNAPTGCAIARLSCYDPEKGTLGEVLATLPLDKTGNRWREVARAGLLELVRGLE